MERTRVGLVGVGTIARTHLAVLGERSDVDLEFTADPAAPGPGPGPHYPDLSSALEAHRPDLVVIATPSGSHADLAALALTATDARVLVEKPLVLDPASLDRLRALDTPRLFTAHHFAFSPEVAWAAALPFGPVTGVTSAFCDPYVLKGEQAFASYTSPWADSGINQLTVLARLVDPVAVTSLVEEDLGAWATVDYASAGTTGLARLRVDWRTGASSKSTAVSHGDVEVWLDHTAMTGFAFRGGELLASFGTDGRTPRKVAHYRPLYESLLSSSPDPVLGFDVAAHLAGLHASPGTRS
ncbi:Gfo/Idh/MocA family oxidoreductase [Saccharothrix sp. Mg75]|uniref:Gfo/Idh/MocA family oxidoreductase n=1 Tax=Saccharothrix sp. Mg75 TaxID=3445357 RepID=UPI003EEED16F